MNQLADFKNASGLELVRTMLDGRSPAEDIMLGTINFHAVSFEKGHAVFEGTPEKRHLNMAGRIHGGWALTLLDTAMGSSVMSSLESGRASTTATMESKFMRPVFVGMAYRCEGFVMKAGRNLAHARSELIEIESGKLVGTATGTFAIISSD